ncbi:MAG: hypothetical protein M4579_001293 [Chaenotheca gracillima]|nr:MAG: hypothetical protein M4579_001293 [Chaenotheca gracillima]
MPPTNTVPEVITLDESSSDSDGNHEVNDGDDDFVRLAHNRTSGRPNKSRRKAVTSDLPNTLLPRAGFEPGFDIDFGANFEIGFEAHFDEIFGDHRSPAVMKKDEVMEKEAIAEEEAISEKEKVIDSAVAVLRDISRDYVGRVYDELADQNAGNKVLPNALLDTILEATLQEPYPKADDNRKRKRASHGPDNKNAAYTSETRPVRSGDEYVLSLDLLLAEFPSIPHTHIAKVRSEKPHIFQAYLELRKAEKAYDPATQSPYRELKAPRKPHELTKRAHKFASWGRETVDALNDLRGALERELQAARQKRLHDEEIEAAEEAAAKAETLNFDKQKEEGLMMPCQCCYNESPLNRMTHCDGATWHFFCFECGRKTAETQIGLSRHTWNCMDMSGCASTFADSEIRRFLNEKAIQMLSRLQQQEEIRLAGVEGLTECPFCDFAAICDSVDVDKEFRCQSEECMKVSCRLCKSESHLPLSCEESKNESGLAVRHALEEAMTEALVRSCGNCKSKFIKEIGCNKMCCPRCKTKQCYICNKVLLDNDAYAHFRNAPGRSITRLVRGTECPLYENTEERHLSEVASAEKMAREKLKTAHPELDEKDLKIEVSKAVQTDDIARRQMNEPPTRGRARPYIREVVPVALGLGPAAHVHGALGRGAFPLNDPAAQPHRLLFDPLLAGAQPGQGGPAGYQQPPPAARQPTRHAGLEQLVQNPFQDLDGPPAAQPGGPLHGQVQPMQPHRGGMEFPNWAWLPNNQRPFGLPVQQGGPGRLPQGPPAPNNQRAVPVLYDPMRDMMRLEGQAMARHFDVVQRRLARAQLNRSMAGGQT